MTTIIKTRKINFPKDKPSVLLLGLPGIGFIGRIAARYIIKKGKGKLFATLLSSHFPAQALMTKKGLLKPLRINFYHVPTKGLKDIIVVVGDIQPPTPEGQFEVALEILNFAKKFNVDEIITMGGYATGNLEENRSVFGVANNTAHIAELSKRGVIFGKAKGSIVGMAGLLPSLAKYKGTPAICLMGETHGAFADATSAKRVLEILAKYLGLELDYSDLDKSVKASEDFMKKLKEELEKTQGGHDKDLSYIR